MAAERSVSSLDTPIKFRGPLTPPSPDWATVDGATRRLAYQGLKPQKVVVAAWRNEQDHRHAVARTLEELTAWEGPSAEEGLNELWRKDDAACVTALTRRTPSIHLTPSIIWQVRPGLLYCRRGEESAGRRRGAGATLPVGDAAAWIHDAGGAVPVADGYPVPDASG